MIIHQVIVRDGLAVTHLLQQLEDVYKEITIISINQVRNGDWIVWYKMGEEK